MKIIILYLLGLLLLLGSCVPVKENADLNKGGPTLSISNPSAFNFTNNSVAFTVTYSGASSVTLTASAISLIRAGSINGSVSVSGSGTTSRVVTISGISGVGSIGFSIAAGTAVDSKSNIAPAVAASPNYTVSSSLPSITITPSSPLNSKSGPIIYILNYYNAASILLDASMLTLDTTGSVDGTINVSGIDNTTRIVSITGITGEGSLGLIVAPNTAVNSAGAFALGIRSPLVYNLDTTPPAPSISNPSATTTFAGPVSFTVNYPGVSSITLTTANITLNTTGTATGSVSVSGTGSTTRTVTISGISGNGTLGISIAAGTAVDAAGNLAVAPTPSTTFNVDSTAFGISISAPTLSSTNTTPTSYTINYSGASSISLNASKVIINKTGTANAVASVTGSGLLTRTVTLSSITGDGTLGISIAANSATDLAGNNSLATAASGTFNVDNTAPTIAISAPSTLLTTTASVDYTLTYSGASSISLSSANITLTKTGNANGIVTVSGVGLTTRTVSIGSITGNGTLSITVAASTAADAVGNLVTGISSASFTVDNTPPTLGLSAPSLTATTTGPVTYTAYYTGASAVTLNAADITLNKTGSATASIAVSGSGTASRTITLSSITGNGSLGINVAASTATDAAGNLAASAGPSSTFTIVTDPLFPYAWHLKNTGQNTFSSGSATSGIDLHLFGSWAQGYLGQGINVLVSDTGVQSAHEDLAGNFLGGSVSKDFINGASPNYLFATAEPLLNNDAGQSHGTAVAGLIAAVGGNGLGSVGVAPSAKIASANFLNSSFALDTVLAQVSGNFNIVNQSWGSSQCVITTPDPTYEAKLKTDRKVYVKSAGNSFAQDLSECSALTGYKHGNSLFDSFNVNPYTIVVAALNSTGVKSSYSSFGSNIWISGFGGEFGDTAPAMVTTDLSGCTYGMSPNDNYNSFQLASHPLNTHCNYTSVMNGTSSAAPTISGVAALILSSNPTLSTRDIKHILALTAIKIDPTAGNTSNNYVASPAGHVWQQGWVTNAANFHFHNYYGFGMVDADAAVNMAKSGYSALPAEVETGYATSGAINLAIPDNSSTGVESTINIAAIHTIEAVQIQVAVTHANIGQLGIELVSPSGTKSILMNINNSLDGIIDLSSEVFLTNAFYGENSAGNWKIKLIDGAAGTTGQLTNWKINIVGH